MRTHYQLLTKNLPQIIELIQNGYMQADLIKHIEIFETYHSLIGNKSKRYKELGERFNMHPNSIKRIILKLKKKVK